MKRRTFIKSSVLGTVAGVVSGCTQAAMSTPGEVEGPFYPIMPQKDQDADLTTVAGKNGTAKGKVIEIVGRVLDTELKPVEGVTIDLWQANSFGKYHHPHDTNLAPVDEHFQAWAIIQSGSEGRFKFKTVMPGAYPLSRSQQRTPHIHFKIGKNGYLPLLTQMYFPNHPLNKQDALFRRKSAREQEMMTAKVSGTGNLYQYDIVIERL